MPESIHNQNKKFIGRLRAALYDINPSTLKSQLGELFAPDCDIKLAFPFENLDGPAELYERAYVPLIEAIPDLDYVGFTAFPGLQLTFSGDGFLGIPPNDREFTMRSLDFWRCENGFIRENWVIVDLLDFYNQMGVDVFERMREMTVARRTIPIR